MSQHVLLSQHVVLYIRFKTRDGRKDEFRRHLYTLVEAMKDEPSFVKAIIHDDPDHPNDIVIYETWQGTRASWLHNELTKPYRAAYEKTLAELLEDRVAVFLTPVDEWKRLERREEPYEQTT